MRKSLNPWNNYQAKSDEDVQLQIATKIFRKGDLVWCMANNAKKSDDKFSTN